MYIHYCFIQHSLFNAIKALPYLQNPYWYSSNVFSTYLTMAFDRTLSITVSNVIALLLEHCRLLTFFWKCYMNLFILESQIYSRRWMLQVSCLYDYVVRYLWFVFSKEVYHIWGSSTKTIYLHVLQKWGSYILGDICSSFLHRMAQEPGMSVLQIIS